MRGMIDSSEFEKLQMHFVLGSGRDRLPPASATMVAQSVIRSLSLSRQLYEQAAATLSLCPLCRRFFVISLASSLRGRSEAAHE